jgi:hypothetical protein
MSWLGKGSKVSPHDPIVKCSGRVGIFCQLGKKDAAIILLAIFDTPLSILIKRPMLRSTQFCFSVFPNFSSSILWRSRSMSA